MRQYLPDLADDVKAWADGAFPARTDASMFLKLYEELGEMIRATPDETPDEVADVFIMLLDFAARRNIDVEAAIQRKMNINRKRTWRQNAYGAFEHVAQDALRVPTQSESGSGNADVGGQALAHDRHNPHANSCRAYGQCLAAILADCPHFADDPLRSRITASRCDGPRSGRSILGGHSHTQQAIDWQGRDQQGRGGGPAHRFSESFETGVPGLPTPKAL